jgi:hypothetical protein
MYINIYDYTGVSQKNNMYFFDLWHKLSPKQPGIPPQAAPSPAFRVRQLLRGAHVAHVGTADGVLAHHHHQYKARPPIDR